MTFHQTADTTSPTNALTVDVEDWFQVSAFDPYLPRSAWTGCESRVERNTARLLELLAERGLRATFFILGWIAQRHPRLVRRIASAGHEVASHGFDHRRVGSLAPAAFHADVRRSRLLLEDVAGVAVRGYRAPSFSLAPQDTAAYELLAEAGYRYSASVAPIHHDHYGAPDAPRHPWRTRSGVLEIPVSTVRLGNRNWPCAGGGFFRLYPYALTRWCLRRINEGEGRPCNFYLHPWEIDPGQPRVPGLTLRTRARHYLQLSRTWPRLRRLLRDFRWGRMDEVYAA